ncbi:fatty-acyl-CoA synthase/long-chain acyl-CoA synthetase [Pacificibacter maritimus]|uniref:Fatty-acyl-CoA synthase/long-chain acyl-CoA synthetase n=1 Tax=Pacificibacter maritimus TaxID=762213 RepID=A0A3N4UPM5_9RHOB|nr:acyl-CoA synthetase [Pacificibacter maritimus]RPE66957.1 fatty-acyl-CoA synthase/long-chain acyl-CoA synthetase [Pacificibacter maritimus]
MATGFTSPAARDLIDAEMPYEDRDVCTTIYERLTRTKDAFGTRPAFSYQITSGPKDRAETLTWSQTHTQVTQAANMFRALGVMEDDVIAYVLPNTNETAITFLGGMVAGKVAPINPLLDASQIASLLKDSKAKVVVTLRAFPKTDIAQKVAEALRDVPSVTTVLEIDLLRYLSPPKSWIVPLIRPKNPAAQHHNAKVLSFTDEIAKHPTTLTFTDTPKDRVAAYFHTGGTTGMPKVAQHQMSGMLYNGWLGARLLFDEYDTIMCPLPMFHVFACHVTIMSMLTSGAHGVFPTPAGYRGDGVFDKFWKLIERWNVTFIITVPTAMSALMQRPIDADISCVKKAFSGSSPLPIELYKKFETATGIEIIEGYGLTEATCLVACNPIGGVKKVGSVGIPFPHTDVKILTQTDTGPVECETDLVGEICIDSPGVFAGSTYTESDKNHKLFHHETYLRTGDLGRIDEDGYLWITGRAKDLIIRGGHNIDPAEIEEALAGHPQVAFVGAIGQPCAYSGELPCAYVELVDDKDGVTRPTVDDLLNYARDHIHERAAMPKYIEILDELPKTAVGKVFKPDLRKRAITRVFDKALKDAGLTQRVTHVEDDKKLGLVAYISPQNAKDTDATERCLGQFSTRWDWEKAPSNDSLDP